MNLEEDLLFEANHYKWLHSVFLFNEAILFCLLKNAEEQ